MKRSSAPRPVKSATVMPERSNGTGAAQKAPISIARGSFRGRVLELAEPLALRSESTSRSDASAQDRRVELLLARRVGADRGDVGARAGRRRRRAAARARPSPSRGASRAAATSAGESAATTRTPGSRTPMSRAQAAVRSGSRPQTWTCASGRTSAWSSACRRAWTPVPRIPRTRVGAAELPGDHRRHRRGAQIGQVSAVVEVRDRLAGLDRDEDDRAVGAPGVGPGDLQSEEAAALAVARLDVDLAAAAGRRGRGASAWACRIRRATAR